MSQRASLKPPSQIDRLLFGKILTWQAQRLECVCDRLNVRLHSRSNAIIEHMHRLDRNLSTFDLVSQGGKEDDIRVNLALALWQQVLYPYRIPLLWHYQSNFHVAWLHHMEVSYPAADTTELIAALFDLTSPAALAQEPWKRLNAIHFDCYDDPESQRRILDQLVREQYPPAQVMRVVLEGQFDTRQLEPPKLLQMAADAGETEAFVRLQSFYRRTEQNKEANGCERIAALLGHADSLFSTAHALRYRQRWDEAYIHFYHAARHGHAGGIVWVAYCAAQGKGRGKDIETTIQWLLQLPYCQSVDEAPILPTNGWPVIPGTRIYAEDALEPMLVGYDRFVKDQCWQALNGAGLIPMAFTLTSKTMAVAPDAQTLVEIQLDTKLGADAFLKECTELCSAIEHVRYRQGEFDHIDHHIDFYCCELRALLSGTYDSDTPNDVDLPKYSAPLIESSIMLREDSATRLKRVLNTIDHFGKWCDAAWLQEKINERQINILHARAKYILRHLINQLHHELRGRVVVRYAQ
jgi:hypothetical protein